MLLVGLLFTIQSCSEDACKNVECNNGVCNDGTCDCSDGYGGSSCEIKFQDAYLGTWNGTDCEGDPASITITPGTNAAELNISNAGIDIVAKITSQNNIIVNSQQVTEPFFGTTLNVNGNGTLKSDGKLDLDLTITSSLVNGQCLIEYTKQ